MLAEEYLYTLLENIEIFWGYPTFLGLMVDQLCLGRVLLIRSWLQVSVGRASITVLFLGSEGILVIFFN